MMALEVMREDAGVGMTTGLERWLVACALPCCPGSTTREDTELVSWDLEGSHHSRPMGAGPGPGIEKAQLQTDYDFVFHL